MYSMPEASELMRSTILSQIDFDLLFVRKNSTSRRAFRVSPSQVTGILSVEIGVWP